MRNKVLSFIINIVVQFVFYLYILKKNVFKIIFNYLYYLFIFYKQQLNSLHLCLWYIGCMSTCTPSVLLHNANATHGFQRFTHPNETIVCAVHTGTVVSGQEWWGGRWGGSLKLSGLKAPDKAEEVLQDVREFRPEAPRAGCRISCCRIIITPHLWWHRPHLWHQPESKSSNLITLHFVKGKMRQLWFCFEWNFCMWEWVCMELWMSWPRVTLWITRLQVVLCAGCNFVLLRNYMSHYIWQFCEKIF